MTQGTQRKVVNIGIGIKHVSVDPLGISVSEYVESQSHKVSTFLLSFFLWSRSCVGSRICMHSFSNEMAGKSFLCVVRKASG